MYAAFTPLVGALLTVMNNLNSVFAQKTGFWLSTILIHLTGLGAASLVLLFRRESKAPGRLPPWAYAGGLVGVGVVATCNYAFQHLDASLAVVLGLLGQIVTSLAMDASGFLGRPRVPIRARSVPGILLVAAGVGVMAAGGRASAGAPEAGAFALAALVAFFSGALPVLSIALNSELARKRGVLSSARANYLVGLSATLVLLLATRPSLAGWKEALLDAGPILDFGGGLMGLAVVISMNLIFPKVKAFTAALLMFGGQAIAGLVIDYARSGKLSATTLAGTLIVLAGLALKGGLERGADKASA